MDRSHSRFWNERDRGLRGRFAGVRPRLPFHREAAPRNRVELARRGTGQAGIVWSQSAERILDLFFGGGAILLDPAVVPLAQAHFSEGLILLRSAGNISRCVGYDRGAANRTRRKKLATPNNRRNSICPSLQN